MSLHKYSYIFRGKGMNPKANRAVIKSEHFELTIIGVSELKDAVDVAKAEVAEGSQIIELCGAFGTTGTQAVMAGINHAIPVGNVSYSLTDINRLHAMLSQNFSL